MPDPKSIQNKLKASEIFGSGPRKTWEQLSYASTANLLTTNKCSYQMESVYSTDLESWKKIPHPKYIYWMALFLQKAAQQLVLVTHISHFHLLYKYSFSHNFLKL